MVDRPDAPPPPAGAPLVLGPVPDTTYWETVAIHGSGPAGGTLLVDTTAAGSKTQHIAGDGSFCVDLPLTAGAVNTFTFRGVDAQGTIGESVTKDVRQEGSPPSPPTGAPPANVATGGATSGSVSVKEGALADMVDGSDSSSVYVSNAWWGQDWVWVTLRERANIDQMRVVSPSDCPLVDYALLYSDDDAPANPVGPDFTGWGMVFDKQGGDGDDSYAAYTPFAARHIAIFFKSADCSSWGHGYHKVSEIEVWTPAGVAPPTQSAPTCNGGG